MITEASYTQMKAKMPEIKQLFQTRHYIQCASLCERLLTRGQAQIHPVHRAYLHFYLALSHDTMAREATMKHRSSELDLAEQHYLAAIAALASPHPRKLDDIPEQSPNSISSEDEHVKARRISDASQQSVASSATSFADEEIESKPKEPIHQPFPSTVPAGRFGAQIPTKRRPAPIIAPNAAQAYHEEQFSADLSSFLSMVRMHLDSVQELKEAAVAPSSRFSFSRSRSSTLSSRPGSRASSNQDEPEMDRLRWARRSVNFRPRFDPSSVRQLCSEALAEL